MVTYIPSNRGSLLINVTRSRNFQLVLERATDQEAYKILPKEEDDMWGKNGFGLACSLRMKPVQVSVVSTFPKGSSVAACLLCGKERWPCHSDEQSQRSRPMPGHCFSCGVFQWVS